MNRRLASFTLLLCLASATLLGAQDKTPVAKTTVPAQVEAKIVLSAPSVCRIGELVRLDVSESVADSFKWLLVPQSQDWLTYEGGAKAVFSARTAGDYQFIVAVAKGGSVDVVTWVVKVMEPPSEPAVDASLTEWIPFWNWELDLPADECQALAASFDDLADRSATLEEPADWIEATAKANRAILGDRVSAWAPMLDKIGAKLLKMAESGDLSTPDDHARVWREIAEGLRAC
jgi:hypothetical protein